MAKIRQSDIETPHFRLPFTISGRGRVLVNEQDTPDDIMDCVKAIIAYPIGSRQTIPSFGIPDPLFKQDFQHTSEMIKSAVVVWEPRVSYDVTSSMSQVDSYIEEVTMRVIVQDG